MRSTRLRETKMTRLTLAANGIIEQHERVNTLGRAKQNSYRSPFYRCAMVSHTIMTKIIGGNSEQRFVRQVRVHLWELSFDFSKLEDTIRCMKSWTK